MAAIRRILFATDFSDASRKAFATAVTLAKAQHATLDILHVVVPFTPIIPEQYINTETWEQIDRQARLWSQQRLRSLTSKATASGVSTVGLLSEGDHAQQIIRAIGTRRADLLVVGTHGRSGLAKFFVGSVAARLVATAPCPVVTVRRK